MGAQQPGGDAEPGPTAPGGGRRARQERTRRELLDAAADVFAEHGYHAASVEQVARAAGYTKGAVYSNFASKEDVFLALLDEHVDRAVASFEELFEATSPRERPRAVGERYRQLDVYDRSWFLLELEFLLYAARNPDVRPRLARRARRTTAWVETLARRHLRELGTPVDEDTAADLAAVLTALTDGLMVAGVADPEGHDPSELLTRAVRWLTAGAAGAPPGPSPAP